MPIPLLTIPDYEARARETMPRAMFDRLFGEYSSPYWVTNTHNLAAFNAIKLRPRVMVDVSHRDLSTEVLGQKISIPVMLAPTGTHQRAHPQGELASARAAGTAGTIMALSLASSYSIEEVADVATGPLWFQLYFFKDRRITATLARRAERAGYTALLVTVDNLGTRSRERENRYSYTLDAERALKNFEGMELLTPDTSDVVHGGDQVMESSDSAVTWSDLAWLRSVTSLPLVIKGVQTAEDARLCAEHGVDGLVVSNHGGLVLEGSRGTMEVLPEVVDAVDRRLEVYLDGGVRRGIDVLKALALGAKAVFVGRAIFWGLSVDGEAGVRHVLEILRDELDQAMGPCGVADVKKVDRSLVAEPNDGRWGEGVVGPLERLAGLLEKGCLTREEFEMQKTKLLSQ